MDILKFIKSFHRIDTYLHISLVMLIILIIYFYYISPKI